MTPAERALFPWLFGVLCTVCTFVAGYAAGVF